MEHGPVILKGELRKHAEDWKNALFYSGFIVKQTNSEFDVKG